ncbi:hypothetical protein [Acidiphilium sp.]|uniref:hypothetical protein n=1 Tax=Acidiphilium sp. TaxID=527 RepID=UPI0025872613|nr:hypothetical protein [Acidiphilium sp.]
MSVLVPEPAAVSGAESPVPAVLSSAQRGAVKCFYGRIYNLFSIYEHLPHLLEKYLLGRRSSANIFRINAINIGWCAMWISLGSNFVVIVSFPMYHDVRGIRHHREVD